MAVESVRDGSQHLANPNILDKERDLNIKTSRIRMILLVSIIDVRERIRTPDTLVRSQVLYPAELRTRITI